VTVTPCGAKVKGAWGQDVHPVIAGLTNTYSSYITTFEEYGVQRYEGASTLYGPHTLDAYIQVRRAGEARSCRDRVEDAMARCSCRRRLVQLPCWHGPTLLRTLAAFRLLSS
jgi:Neutral/alkaline non-lysosomal ceramidase, N-terminal